MNKNRTSIFERLKKSRNRTTRLQFAHEWADNWEAKHVSLIANLKRAINDDDRDAMITLFGELRGLHEPKFRALHNVINELDSPTRDLID